MRITQKYKLASKLARAIGINPADYSTQQNLYDALNSRGYYWDTEGKKWKFTEADPPTQLLKIRILSGGKERTKELADRVARALTNEGLLISSKSRPYVCREPQLNDYRVYLDIFVPTPDSTNSD